jgi:hypothetical protein
MALKVVQVNSMSPGCGFVKGVEFLDTVELCDCFYSGKGSYLRSRP